MEARELRIGNCVKIGSGFTKVVAIRQRMVETEDAHMFLKDVDGIPLTEEWLLKFGAKRLGNSFFIGKLKFDINTIRKIRFFWSGKVTYLDYVHQLQNLYFALTGEELTIQETNKK